MNTLYKQVEKVVQLTNGRNTKQVIVDLMQLLCNLISDNFFIHISSPNTVVQFSDEFRLELTYYKKHAQAWNELQILAEMFMQSIKDSKPFTDLIGDLYGHQLKGNRLGQFLTPNKLAYGLGKILMQSSGEIKEPVLIGDPTGCGSGSLILGQLKATLELYGKNSIKNMDVLAVDIDMNLVKMTTIQVILNSIFHNIPLRSFSSHRANMITEYKEFNKGKQVLYLWIPNYKPQTTHIEKAVELSMELEKEMTTTMKKEIYENTL